MISYPWDQELRQGIGWVWERVPKMPNSYQPRFTITNRITEVLTRIERARGLLEAATLSKDWIREMGERALVLEAHHTTHIEGTQLTLD